MLYMISYDLMTPGQNYTKLDTYIRSAGGREVLRSQWLVTSTATCTAVFNDLSQRIDNNDRLLVTELTQNMSWKSGGLMITDAEAEAFRRQARL